MYRGNRIDVRVRRMVKNDPKLSKLKRNYSKGPDFINPKTNKWWDMTTPSAWLRHVEKYQNVYGPNGTLLKTTL